MSTRSHKFGRQNQGGPSESDDENGYNYAGNQESYGINYANEDEDDDYDDDDEDDDDDDDDVEDDDDDESTSTDEEKKDAKMQDTPEDSKNKA